MSTPTNSTNTVRATINPMPICLIKFDLLDLGHRWYLPARHSPTVGAVDDVATAKAQVGTLFASLGVSAAEPQIRVGWIGGRVVVA